MSEVGVGLIPSGDVVPLLAGHSGDIIVPGNLATHRQLGVQDLWDRCCSVFRVRANQHWTRLHSFIILNRQCSLSKSHNKSIFNRDVSKLHGYTQSRINMRSESIP